MASVSIVCVTHDSGMFISKLMESLEGQTKPPDRVVIVDSGSSSTAYLQRASDSPLQCTVILEQNIGFAAACNAGWNASNGHDFIFFLNPDAFPAPQYLEQAMEYMESQEHQRVGVLTGTLLGYDIATGSPTGLVDSTGILQTWFGRFYDRHQGKPLSVLERYGGNPNSVTAICGAAMFARETALQDIAKEGILFQPDYFMYKEDIELSLRLSQARWKLVHHPGLTAYHCRGWKSRKAAPKAMRLLSARNEVRLFYSTRSPFLPIGILKYFLVRIFGL